MRRRIKPAILWLFVTPLMIPALLWGVKQWHRSQSILINVGGYKTAKDGEKAALKKLEQTIQTDPKQGLIRIGWDVVTPALHPTPNRGYDVWLYSLYYYQHDQRLLHFATAPYFTDPNQVYVVQYDAVTRKVISSVALSNGDIQSLALHGATLTRQGDARYDEKQGLVFR